MRASRPSTNADQLDLLGDAIAPEGITLADPDKRCQQRSPRRGQPAPPTLVPITLIDEDPASPRIDFAEADLDALTADICLRGLLVPLVVHPADESGHHRLHFGARRLRAACRAGLTEVPVVVRLASADRYAQVAENLKRADLSPLDLARFIRQQIDAGDSQAEVSRRLGLNLTTVAHHLSLLDLPPVLDAALKSGRCASPRTLHELRTLNEQQPEEVRALLDGPGPVTREAVASLRDAALSLRVTTQPASTARLVQQANAACARLERLIARIQRSSDEIDKVGLAALRTRLLDLVQRLPEGSDRQTPESVSKPRGG